MNRIPVLLALAGVLIGTVIAAAAPNFTGEYSDKSFLGGQAVFQMSLEQSGNSVKLWFSTGYSDGRGAAPEAGATGKVTNKGTVEFKFDDTSKNLGTGTITRAGDDLIVSLKTTRVAEPRCLEFYRQNIRLKPAGKK